MPAAPAQEAAFSKDEKRRILEEIEFGPIADEDIDGLSELISGMRPM